jgi:hypothetical protein
MIADTSGLRLAVLLYGSVVCLTSCTTTPQSSQPSQPVPSGSAAFAPYNEPWQKDLIHSVAPVYSFDDRAAWRQGCGLFHLVLERSTGAVVQVTVKKSTGYATLDASAIQALKQWRFRPGSWKTLDIPVDFTMARTKADYREKVRQYQQQQREL